MAYQYKIEQFPANKPFTDKEICYWFERMHSDGWELVSVDYTKVWSGGYESGGRYQRYIFRKQIFENTPDHQFIDK